jgi:hypothetical protein
MRAVVAIVGLVLGSSFLSAGDPNVPILRCHKCPFAQLVKEMRAVSLRLVVDEEDLP